MNVLEITTIYEAGRDAQSVHEFYYADYAPNYLRAMTARMIEEGKILNRFVCLHDTGDKMTVFTMFESPEARGEWRDSKEMQAARRQWDGRGWEGDTQVIQCNEIIDVAAWSRR